MTPGIDRVPWHPCFPAAVSPAAATQAGGQGQQGRAGQGLTIQAVATRPEIQTSSPTRHSPFSIFCPVARQVLQSKRTGSGCEHLTGGWLAGWLVGHAGNRNLTGKNAAAQGRVYASRIRWQQTDRQAGGQMLTCAPKAPAQTSQAPPRPCCSADRCFWFFCCSCSRWLCLGALGVDAVGACRTPAILRLSVFQPSFALAC